MEVSLEQSGMPIPPPRRKRSSPQVASSPHPRSTTKPQRPSVPPRPFSSSSDHKKTTSTAYSTVHGAGQRSIVDNDDTRTKSQLVNRRDRQSPTKSATSSTNNAPASTPLRHSRSGDSGKPAGRPDRSNRTGSKDTSGSPTKKRNKPALPREVTRESNRTSAKNTASSERGLGTSASPPSSQRELRRTPARHEPSVKPDPPLRPSVAPTVRPSRPSPLPHSSRNKTAPYSQLYGSTQSLPAVTASIKDEQKSTSSRNRTTRGASLTREELSTSPRRHERPEAIRSIANTQTRRGVHTQAALDKEQSRSLKKSSPTSPDWRRSNGQTRTTLPRTPKIPPGRPAPPLAKSIPSPVTKTPGPAPQLAKSTPSPVTKTPGPLNGVRNLRKPTRLQTKQPYEDHIYMEVGRMGHQLNHSDDIDDGIDYPYVIMSAGESVHTYMPLDLHTADECQDYDVAQSMVGSKALVYTSQTNNTSLSKQSQSMKQLYTNNEHLQPDISDISSAKKVESDSEIDHEHSNGGEDSCTNVLQGEARPSDEPVKDIVEENFRDKAPLRHSIAEDYDSLAPVFKHDEGELGLHSEGDYDRLERWDDQSPPPQKADEIDQTARGLKRDAESLANNGYNEREVPVDCEHDTEEIKLTLLSENEVCPSECQSLVTQQDQAVDREEIEGRREDDSCVDQQHVFRNDNVSSSDVRLEEEYQTKVPAEGSGEEEEPTDHFERQNDERGDFEFETVSSTTEIGRKDVKEEQGQQLNQQSSEDVSRTDQLPCQESQTDTITTDK